MKKIIYYIAIVSLAILLLIQLIPRNKSNRNDRTTNLDISSSHHVPDSISSILRTSCYDCHSNNTQYPWYANIQPVNLWLAHHIDEGKDELNFSEFGQYSVRKKYFKLREIIDEVEENKMPLSSYTLVHRTSRLNEMQKRQLISWTTALIDSFENVYPSDTLRRRKK